MLKAIKIRLYPTDIQAAYINRQLGCCRFVYNSVLAWRKELYETERRTPSSSEISAFYLNLRNTYLFLREVHSKPQRQALMDLDKAYANFFRGLKNGQHVGFPNFKSKKEYNDSCRFPVDAFRGVKGNRISFTRELSDIHFKCSRRDEKYLNKWQKNVRSSTLRKTPSGRYYASILINCTDQEPKHVRTISPEKLKTKAVGVDMGIIDETKADILNLLLIAGQKNYLQNLNEMDNMTPQEIEKQRATTIRNIFSQLQNTPTP